MPATLSSPLAALFPLGVVAAETRELGDVGQLKPQEAACLGNAVASRAREFAAGRLCAHRAMAEFGIVDFPLTVAADRRPVWPPSLVGSISHTSGMCVAVVAERRRLYSVGIDCEVVGDVKSDIWRLICVAQEIVWLKTLPVPQQKAAAALLFSAKESFYKCQYGAVAEQLNFHDVRVELDWGSTHGEFMISPQRALACAALSSLPICGKYRFHDEFVTTGVAFVARSQ